MSHIGNDLEIDELLGSLPPLIFYIIQKSGLVSDMRLKFGKFFWPSNLSLFILPSDKQAQVGKDCVSEMYWHGVLIRRNHRRRQRQDNNMTYVYRASARERERSEGQYVFCLAKLGGDVTYGHLSITYTEVFAF